MNETNKTGLSIIAKKAAISVVDYLNRISKKINKITKNLEYQKILMKFEMQKIINKETGCWEFPNQRKYPFAGIINNKKVTASYASYLIHHGEIEEGLFVCHHCDNAKCFAPLHLFKGTAKDNHNDMVKKQRAHWQKKYTPMKKNKAKNE